MNGNWLPRQRGRAGRWAVAVLIAGLWSTGPATAQMPAANVNAPPQNVVVEGSSASSSGSGAPITDPGVVQAGCPTCGGHLFGGCTSCGGGPCVPGQYNCCSGCPDTICGRLIGGLHDCICCPDPCYQPIWIAAANAALFTDPVRPATQMTFRYDGGLNLTVPDRAEYFWAKIGAKGPTKPEFSLQYNDLHLIAEMGTNKFSVAIDTLYRSIDPEVNPHAANFGDLMIATKSMLLDCELLQLAFQFKTYIPTGNFTHGIGTGHVSLEPGLIAALRLTCDTYLQGEIEEWIPLGGDSDYQGALLEYHFSLNQVLWRPMGDVQVIGTAEFNGWSFQTGEFTSPEFQPAKAPFIPSKAGGESFLSAGPGLRIVFCDKVDLGVGAAFALTERPMPRELYRLEFRWRF